MNVTLKRCYSIFTAEKLSEQRSYLPLCFKSTSRCFPELLSLLTCLIFLRLISYHGRFDGKKKRVGSKEKLEKQRLLHKYKRERKGAMREIRKDAQFLARQKLNERIQR